MIKRRLVKNTKFRVLLDTILNVPNLRFPGFCGEWEQHLLSEYLEFKNGLNPSAKSFGEGIKFISVMDILNNPYITYDCIRASVNASEKEKQEFNVEYGDILFQRSSETLEDVGHANVYLDKKPALFGGFTIRGKKKGDYNPLFFKYLLDSPKARKKVIVKGAGAQHFNIGQEGLSSVSLYFPSKQEQKKIAELFELLDQRIAIQNKVIEKLKSLIRELNNKLMDNPLWNKVYLGDFMQFYSTNSLSWEQLSYESGRMKNLHYGLIHIGLPTMTDCKDNTLPYIQAPFIPKQFTICKDGDIAFADASEDTEEVGKAIELYNTGSMDVVCGLHTIHGRDIMGLTVVGFKGFAFNSKYFHDQLRRLAQGSKVYSITAENIKNCYIYVPEVTEQRRIVGLLLCLQDKIKCAERELNSYEMQKQFMLSEMLV